MFEIQCQCGAIMELGESSLSKPIQCPRCGGTGSITAAQAIEFQIDESNASDQMVSVPVAEIAVAEEVVPLIASSWSKQAEEINPFEAPRAPLLPSAASSSTSAQELVVREGLIFGKSPIVLPQYCVECGEPVGVQYYRTNGLSHFSPWLGLLFFLGPLGWMMLLVLFFLTRKRCLITYGFCNTHQQKRRRRLWACTITAIGSFVAMSTTIVIFNNRRYEAIGGFLIFSFMIVFIVSLFSIPFMRTGLYIKSYIDKIFAIKGCKPAFLKWIQ